MDLVKLDATKILLIVVLLINAFFIIDLVTGWGWIPDIFKKPTTVTTITYVPDTLTAQIMGFKVDSLKGIIVQKDVVIAKEQKVSKLWRKHVARLDSLVASMQDTLNDTIHTIDAVLSIRIPSEPDTLGNVYMDSLHVAYDIGLDAWHDIELHLEPRLIPYTNEVIETIKEVPYIPLWIALPVIIIIAVLVGAVAF